jgi:hypothetical protein
MLGNCEPKANGADRGNRKQNKDALNVDSFEKYPPGFIILYLDSFSIISKGYVSK